MATSPTQGTAVPAGSWVLDPVHSSVQFTVTDVSDLMSTIRGRFTEYEGVLETGDNLEGAQARGVIKAASIDTDQAQRDEHLRSPDLLDTDNHEDILFESTRIDWDGEERLTIAGILTLKGQPEEVQLDARLRGVGTSSQGGERMVISTAGEIEFGPMTVGLSVEVTAIRQES